MMQAFQQPRRKGLVHRVEQDRHNVIAAVRNTVYCGIFRTADALDDDLVRGTQQMQRKHMRHQRQTNRTGIFPVFCLNLFPLDQEIHIDNGAHDDLRNVKAVHSAGQFILHQQDKHQ